MKHFLSYPIIYLIKAYQVIVSPLFISSCRFYPSCSSYAIETLKTYGVWQGIYLTLKRILKCHPFHPGGYDPVK